MFEITPNLIRFIFWLLGSGAVVGLGVVFKVLLFPAQKRKADGDAHITEQSAEASDFTTAQTITNTLASMKTAIGALHAENLKFEEQNARLMRRLVVLEQDALVNSELIKTQALRIRELENLLGQYEIGTS